MITEAKKKYPNPQDKISPSPNPSTSPPRRRNTLLEFMTHFVDSSLPTVSPTNLTLLCKINLCFFVSFYAWLADLWSSQKTKRFPKDPDNSAPAPHPTANRERGMITVLYGPVCTQLSAARWRCRSLALLN